MKKNLLQTSKSFLGGMALLLLLSAVGCSLIEPVNSPPIKAEKGIGPCTENADCLNGQICYKRYCRTMDTVDGKRVDLQLLIPSSIQYNKNEGRAFTITKQQFIGVDLSTVQNGAIYPREAFTVKGVLWSWGQNEQAQRDKTKLSAKIRFSDQESISGQPLYWEVETSSEHGGQFQIQLSYGTYTIDVFPKDNNIPPYRLTDVQVQGDKELQIELPEKTTCTRLEGQIIAAHDTNTPLQNIQIEVLTAEGWIMSNVATTDSNGLFKLWLTRNKTPQTLRLRMSNSKGRFHPEVNIPYSLAAGKKQASDNVLSLGKLPVGFKSKSVELTGNIHFNQQGIANSRIRFTGEIDLGTYKTEPLKGTYTRETVSDNNGNYEVELPPGRYQIEVIPPSHSLWSRAIIQPQPLLKDKEVNVGLIEKYNIVGNICSAGELGDCAQRIENAQVRAVWRGPHKESTIAQSNAFSVGSSSLQIQQAKADGSYQLNLDPGIYDLIFIPPADSPLAREFVRVCLRDKELKLNAFLPRAQYLVGQVMGPDRAPIGGVILEMYEHKPPTGQSARLLGRATANSKGHFSIPHSTPNPTPNDACRDN